MQFITQHNANLVHGVSIVGTKGVQGKKQALLRADLPRAAVLRAAVLESDRARLLADRPDPSTELPETSLLGSHSESGLGKQPCPGYSRSLPKFAASRIAARQANWRRVAGRTAVPVDQQVDMHAVDQQVDAHTIDQQVDMHAVVADHANARPTNAGDANATTLSAHAGKVGEADAGATQPQTVRSVASVAQVELSNTERPQAEPARTFDMAKVASPAIWATFVLSRALSS